MNIIVDDRSTASKDDSKSSTSTPSGSLSGEKHQINAGKEAAMEAELRAARERAALPLETRISSFKEMLAEKEVRINDMISLTNA